MTTTSDTIDTNHTNDTIDVRSIPPRERHALIFGRFQALLPGQTLDLLNDHDPAPLRQQFAQRWPGQFDWRYLSTGPALWQVRIARRAGAGARPAADSCCSGGACCG